MKFGVADGGLEVKVAYPEAGTENRNGWLILSVKSADFGLRR